MSFEHPLVLILLVLLPVTWMWPRRPGSIAEGVTRALALGAVIFALARPVILESTGPAYLVLVEDPAQPTDVEASSETVVTRVPLAPGASLGAALGRASAAIPSGARGAVLVTSAGLTSVPDWSRATQDLVSRGVPVHPRLLPVGNEARPVRVAPVGEVRVGQVAQVEVDLVGEGSGELVLTAGDQELARQEIDLSGRARAVLEFEPEEEGWLEVTATYTGRSFLTTLAVQRPLKIFHLGRESGGGADALGELLGGGFDVVPASDESNFGTADLVVIDDLPARDMDEAAQEELARAVTEGGLGLVMAGGGAFGPGGWHDTPVMDVMPVEAVQKEEKRDPSTTLVVIIDTSGSMGGNRVQLAKEVSRLAIGRLLPHDKVGIVEFFGAKRWAAPIQPASNRIELERALNRLNAGGGTVILPAIEEAFYGLQNVQTRYKHVLVLTDGGVERGSFEPLIRRMSDEGITVSTVLIGPNAHSEFLVSISNWGKGRFYSVPNRFNLPEILLKQPTSAKLPAWRSGDHTVRARGGSGWWGEVDPNAIPALDGYVETHARPGAQVLLETETGAHPLLATWRPGLGRSTAMTTSPTGRGSEPWSGWDGYGEALARILSRTAADQRHPWSWTLERSAFEVRVTAERRRADAGAPTLELDSMDEVPLHEVAPGRYEARLVRLPDEAVRLVARGAGTVHHLVAPAAPVADAIDPAMALDLAALADASGGEVLAAAPTRVPAVGGGGGEVRLADRRSLCLWLALLLMLANVTLRRLDRTARS